METILAAPIIAEPLGLFDCCGVSDILDGVYDADGAVPCQIDGGLKCFGHPVGASGLRMGCGMYNQLLGRAGKRQLSDPVTGVARNLGGWPMSCVAGIAIHGRLEQ